MRVLGITILYTLAYNLSCQDVPEEVEKARSKASTQSQSYQNESHSSDLRRHHDRSQIGPILSSLGDYELTTTVEISHLIFPNEGTPADVCHITPQIPEGLVVETHERTCRIYGAPKSSLAKQKFQVTASDSNGNQSAADITLAITTANPPKLSKPESQFLVVGKQFDFIRIKNTGADAVFCREDTPLPLGLELRVKNGSCAIAGTPLSRQQTSKHYVRAFSQDGSSSRTYVEITVLEIPPILGSGKIETYQFVQGKASPTIKLAATEGHVTSCFSTPSLPNGMKIEVLENGCSIQGTPQNLLKPTEYTFTAQYGRGHKAHQYGIVSVIPSQFVSQWKTDNLGGSLDHQIQLPLTTSGHYDFHIEWGDGTTDHITSYEQGTLPHSYPTSGVYTITISGDIEGWGFTEDTNDSEKILAIRSWGPLKPGNHGHGFNGARNLVITAEDLPLLEGITNFESFFNSCLSLTKIPYLEQWDVSNAESMSRMFKGARNFNQDINLWNVAKVKNMSELFFDAESFNRPLNDWDVRNVSNFSGMFSYTDTFNQPLNEWNIQNAKILDQMFQNAASFNQSLNKWDTSQVISMHNMFHAATAFNQDLQSWDVSKVENMWGMFFRAESFNQDLNDWNVSSVKNFSSMFGYANSFNGNIRSWDTGSATNMAGMFNHALIFNQDISSWDLSNVTTTLQMFRDTMAFNQDLNEWDVGNVRYMNEMFMLAEKFNGDISNWDVSSVERMRGMFKHAKSFDQDISNWDISNVTTAWQLFDGAASFNQNIGHWNVSGIKIFQQMFRDARSFNQDLSNWDLSQATSLYDMFKNAESFNQDLSNWDISKVKFMNEIFVGTSLTTETYDQTLIGWSQLGILEEGVELTAGDIRHSSISADARSILENTFQWNIIDGGTTSEN